MYYYIVDPQKISQRDFERVQNLLYSSLSEYRISGEVVRVTGLRSINQLVESAFERGVKTLVAVGSEHTLDDVINAIKSRDIVVGFIPLINSELGPIFGIKDIGQAAKTIAGRRIEQIDLGIVNQTFFVNKLTFGLNFAQTKIRSFLSLPNFEVKFSVNEEYQANINIIAGKIVNQLTSGVAEVTFLPKLSSWQTLQHYNSIKSTAFDKIPQSSRVLAKKIEITTPGGLPLRAGDRVIAKTPAVIEILPKALKIIVGKDRQLA